MRRPPGAGRTHLGAAALTTLTTAVASACPLEPGDPAQLLAVRFDPHTDPSTDPSIDPHADRHADPALPGEVELLIRALEPGSHPLDALLGFEAPIAWAAIGVVATGRATALDVGDRFAVRAVQLVGRDGAWASRFEPVEGPADRGASASSADGAPVPSGRIDDALRLAIGVPTAPPPAPVATLWAAQWLDAVVTEALRRPHRTRRRPRPTVAEVLARHPAVAGLGLTDAEIDVELLTGAGTRFAEWRGWGQLRRACAAGRWASSEVDAETADWFDDGAFARALLAGWPELVDLRDTVAALLEPGPVAAVDEVLARWRLLAVADPDEGGH